MWLREAFGYRQWGQTASSCWGSLGGLAVDQSIANEKGIELAGARWYGD